MEHPDRPSQTDDPLKNFATIALASAAGVIAASRMNRPALFLAAGLALAWWKKSHKTQKPSQPEDSDVLIQEKLPAPAPALFSGAISPHNTPAATEKEAPLEPLVKSPDAPPAELQPSFFVPQEPSKTQPSEQPPLAITVTVPMSAPEVVESTKAAQFSEPSTIGASIPSIEEKIPEALEPTIAPTPEPADLPTSKVEEVAQTLASQLATETDEDEVPTAILPKIFPEAPTRPAAPLRDAWDDLRAALGPGLTRSAATTVLTNPTSKQEIPDKGKEEVANFSAAKPTEPIFTPAPELPIDPTPSLVVPPQFSPLFEAKSEAAALPIIEAPQPSLIAQVPEAPRQPQSLPPLVPPPLPVAPNLPAETLSKPLAPSAIEPAPHSPFPTFPAAPFQSPVRDSEPNPEQEKEASNSGSPGPDSYFSPFLQELSHKMAEARRQQPAPPMPDFQFFPPSSPLIGSFLSPEAHSSEVAEEEELSPPLLPPLDNEAADPSGSLPDEISLPPAAPTGETAPVTLPPLAPQALTPPSTPSENTVVAPPPAPNFVPQLWWPPSTLNSGIQSPLAGPPQPDKTTTPPPLTAPVVVPREVQAKRSFFDWLRG